MNVSINLLPDHLRRRSIRTQVIRIWVLILAGVSIAIAFMSHLRWTQCNDLQNLCETTRPTAEIALRQFDEVNGTEQRIAVLRSELDSHEKLHASQNPLSLLQIVSPVAAGCGDQLRISGMDILNSTGTAVRQEATVTTSLTPETEITKQPTRRTFLQLRGIAVSEFAVTRFMNKLRQSGGFPSVQLKSSQVSSDSSEMKREFIVECIREELLQ